MDRRWRPPLLGGALWLLSPFAAALLERAHVGTEHTGRHLIGLASGVFGGSLFGAVLPRAQRAYLWGAIPLFLVLSAGGVQQYLAARNDLYLLQPAMFGGAACGMVLTLWYRARISIAISRDDPEVRPADPPQERR